MTPLPVMQLPTESRILYSHNLHHTGIRHPELVSGSVRGEGPEKARGERSDKAREKELVKARGEMLKQVQHDEEGNSMT